MDEDDEQTFSVSKGVFVFKNNFKPLKQKRRKSFQSGSTANIFSDNLWYKCYSELWETIEEKIETLNNEMFSSVLSDLIAFIEKSHDSTVDEIPTAALLTGINMPDHEAQFKALSRQIKQTVSPHVACLYSQDCQNLKYLIENMIRQFINEGESVSNDEEMETEEHTNQIKRNMFNLSVLQCWYEDLYKDNLANTPKKQKTKSKKKVLVVILPDFESFTPQILQKFILIVNWYIKKLPFVFVFGIATSINTLHTTLPYKVSSKICTQVFNSQPSTEYLNMILEEVFFTLECPFQLGGRVFNLFTDIFLFYDFSVSNFIHNIKYAMAEHFSFGNAMALCSSNKQDIKRVLNSFSHEDCENARRIPSFRKLVENEQDPERRIKLLTDDDYLKSVLKEVDAITKYVRRLHIFLKCLHILVSDLPKAPLGKQVRELYSFAVSSDITNTSEYKECLQLLGFQSKDELTSKLSRILDYISSIVKYNDKPNKMKDFEDELSRYLNSINNLDMDNNSEEDVVQSESQENVIAGQMDRKQLKEKLLEMSKKPNKPMNKYEKLRENVLQFLSDTFKQYLVQPNSLYFYEIFFFDNISIQNYIIGTHRSAIHNALNDPQYYLQCKCCNIANSSVIKPTMPDICIAYKLHLECGKVINLYDWLQAFLTIVDPVDVDDDSKRTVDPELQARFTQAVAELEFLGFIKSSKRKADHVARLTWGG